MEYQTEAILVAHKRDEHAGTGHSPIMRPYVGKTLIHLYCYYRQLIQQERQGQPRTSKIKQDPSASTICRGDNLTKKAAKDHVHGASTKQKPKSFYANLMSAVDNSLAEKAPSSSI
eukprot:8542397-Ditylum_brightwellii.AAC.1